MEPALPCNVFENLPAPYAIITCDSGTPVIHKVNKALAGFVRAGAGELEGQPVTVLAQLYDEITGTGTGDFMTVSLQAAFTAGTQQTSGYFSGPANDAHSERSCWMMRHTPVVQDDGDTAYVIHSIVMETCMHGGDEKISGQELGNYPSALDIAREQYAALFNCSPIPMWIYDMETYRFTDVNLAAVRNYGYSREEFLALSIKDIRPEEDIPVVMESVANLRRFDNRYSRKNYRHLKKNGELIHVRIESNVTSINGRKSCIVLALDITQSKLDEAALQRKNELMDAINKFTTILLGRGRPVNLLNKAFGVIGATVNVDRVYFYQSYAYRSGINLVNQRIEWNRDSALPVIDNPEMQQLSLSVADLAAGLLPGGRFAAIVNDLPESSLKSFLLNQKALSVAALPIFVDDKFYGFIGFEHLREEHKWQEDEFAFLEAVTGHLATAIERYNAAKALKNSKEQFRSVINNLPGITYRCKSDKDWTMVFISDEAERMIGYPPAAFINNAERSFASVIHPDDREQTFCITEQLDRHEPFQIEYRIVRSDGRAIWVKDIGRGVYNSNGQLLWIDGVILDVTERVEQEQQLRVSNERFRLVMKASREAIIDWDIVNDATIWGDGFSETFRYDLSVYDNHIWSRNIHPEDKAWVMTALEDTMADPARDTLDLHFRFLKDGGETAYVHHRGIFIRNADGVAVRAIGSMADVTEFTLHARKIEQQNEVLKEIAWMQSHVVRAPFARLMGLMALLKDELPAAEVTDTLGYMEESARELDRIITDIVIKSEQVNSKTSDGRTVQHIIG